MSSGLDRYLRDEMDDLQQFYEEFGEESMNDGDALPSQT